MDVSQLSKLEKDLVFFGKVESVPGANQFGIPRLGNLGETSFVGWTAYVWWDAGGAAAAPQGESQVVTAYTEAGDFTTGAFTAAVAAGDIILLLHPRIAEIEALAPLGLGSIFQFDYWSVSQEEVAVTAVAGDLALPNVVVAGIPAGATVVRVVAMFKSRVIENTNAAVNKLNGAQEIQVRDDTPGAWADAINFVDDQFGLAASTREGGDVIVGAIDLVATVDGNDTYNFQWASAVADQANLQFNDVQVGLRVWYRV